MERVCEFCKATTAVVYCIADAANLCLSCDAKVHSANALSTRHLRTLLCDSCKHQPCVVECLDDKMFVCNGCNNKLHGVSSEHHRQHVSCYKDCPSAKDFAVMWGFQVMDSDSLEHSFSMGIPEMLAPFGERDVQRDAVSISKQILELGSKEETDPFPLDGNTCETLIDLPQTGKSLMVEISASPFSQVEQLSSSSILGDLSFWECRSPYRNNQLWHQNLLDIGVCEDTVCHDDFHTPDVDLSFRNFDEVFGSDQQAIADKNTFFISSHEMRASSSLSFNNSLFEPQSVSSTLSLSEQACYASLSTNARPKTISRLKEKKRARAEDKKA